MAAATALPGAAVYGLRRSVQALPPGIAPVPADLATGAGFDGLPTAIDTLIFAPTPAARSEEGYRAIYVDALSRLFDALPQPDRSLRLIYVSSTAVYGQDAGEIVDEGSECQPQGFNGKVLLEGEQLAARLIDNCVALRLSGLYGPGRH
ncbi:MAG TPA: SDR family NAD(P)-dependent oxidoreductase, partial [Xanthomonadales bacterium]|nr:SDR family NAD(P)-dependent oxidoreductase [Xanthomonadales bacterium]